MPLERSDPAHLWDMLQAARTALDFMSEASIEEYLEDAKLRSAVERQIEIIGEAARRLSDAFRDAHPEFPWQRIIAQRNVLIHDYGEIDHQRIWNLVAEYIPHLIEQPKPLVPAPPE